MALILFLLVGSNAVSDTNMNQGGVPYGYSNPPGSTKNWKGTPGVYPLEFESNVKGTVEHFDVYGEVRTNYSEVYWTRNLPINLPQQLVERFKDKVMVITGYEVDQVTHNGDEPNSTTTDTQLGGFSCYPSCDANGEDKSVPIYNAYNHHYFSWLISADAELIHKTYQIPDPTNTYFTTKNGTNHTYPTSIVYKENPGGEFRKSYHGYASGYGQFIYNPTQWIVEPMQVDTHNRNYDINDATHGYVPYILPKSDTNNNITDLNNGLSPLIECPCTDRITKTKIETPIILTNGTCGQQMITSKDECGNATEAAGIIVHNIKVYNDPSQIAGCSIKPRRNAKDLYAVSYNNDTDGLTCGDGSIVAISGNSNLGNLTTLKIDHNGDITGNITITISGPSTVWYGVGFNATVMADEPYAIIIDGIGGVTERKLANHAPGILLNSTITVLSNTVSNGRRTVVMTRPLRGMEYCAVSGSMGVITAIGDTVELSYHAARTAATIILLPTNANACICKTYIQQFITYMDTQTNGFGYTCVGPPRSDMLEKGDGTGRYGISNKACDIDTYLGGLQCCKHKFLLTDRDQESLIPVNKTDKYFLKWRYYFQEYVPPTTYQNASHKHLHHWVFLIDDAINDYEEDNIESMYGVSGIGKITANLTARDIGLEDIGKNAGAATEQDNGNIPPVPFYSNTTIMPLVMTPHCHAPSCIRQELWNADTGEIICNMTAKYGNEKYGSLYDIFNEPNYITIIPCIFGYQPGLQYPFILKQDTNLTAIKYFNNTWRHLGQMAQWTGLMVYSTDPY